MEESYDAIIIGGGPAGLTAGIYLLRAGVNTLLLEKMLPGGAPVNTEHIENYPGFPEGISGRALMDLFSGQARALGLSIKEFSEVQGVEKGEKGFTVKTVDGSYYTKGIIVASGCEPAKMGIPGENEFLGRGISYCATCDGAFFRGLEVAVIGGGDSAIVEALSLAHLVKKVYIIHRRDSLRAQKILQERAFREKKIEFLWNKRPIEIKGKEQIESIVLEDTKTKEILPLRVDGVFVYIGIKPNTAFLGDLVDRDGGGFIYTDNALSTKTKGIYAAGDVRVKTLRQISTAVGDGATAAVSLERYLLGDQ
ncbi:MAG: thioredoxin-disulfide reductase [Syntrophorhabdaceae bacterium]|nr:thioredoxin-disulfide reductase [Syntrophorhabdaceae bacterium]